MASSRAVAASPREYYGLTPRQYEILVLIASGWTNFDICRTLYLSGSTVKNHIATIKRKLRVDHRAAMIAMAFREGLVTVDQLKDRPPR